MACGHLVGGRGDTLAEYSFSGLASGHIADIPNIQATKASKDLLLACYSIAEVYIFCRQSVACRPDLP